MASEKIDKIIAQVEQMTVLELADLVGALEERFGVSAAAPMAMMAATPAAQVVEEEEKTEFDVVLKEIGPKKIQVIKTVRQVTSLGLKEAKALVDSAPSTVIETVPKETAEEVKAKLETAGATIEIR